MAAALAERLRLGACVILDGGFSTHCEALGADLSVGKLWSARLITDEPATISAVHTDFLAAGADVIGTASYQGTIRGFVAEGCTPEQAAALLTKSVTLALGARDAFWAGLSAEAKVSRSMPLVGACIGPFGGFLADGSEYSGAYGLEGEGGLTATELMDFHREQVTVLCGAGADLLWFETLPCAMEARAIASLLEAEFPASLALLSFSCQDESRLNSGEAFAPAVAAIESCPQILAVGVNCTPPHLIAPLLSAAAAVSAKPLVAYGNSGEEFTSAGAVDNPTPGQPGWSGQGSGVEVADYAELATGWLRATQPQQPGEEGGRGCLIGGCCRTTPAHIAAVCKACAPLASDAAAAR